MGLNAKRFTALHYSASPLKSKPDPQLSTGYSQSHENTLPPFVQSKHL